MDPTDRRWPHYEMTFLSLFDERAAFSFPCDHEGRVDIDRLSEKARTNYLFARAMIGRDYALPLVHQLELA